MICPSCRGTIASHEGPATCPGCRGIWLSHATLAVLAEDREVAIPRPLGPVDASQTGRVCPACGAAMTVQLAGGDLAIAVDVCEQDGVWFDRFELGPLLDELDQEAAARREAEKDASQGPWWLRLFDAITGPLDTLGEADIRAGNRGPSRRPPPDP